MSVTITMKNPWAPFPYYLAQAQTGYVAAPSMLNAADGGTANPVGTGPFVFQDWVPNSHMTAKRNPHYWRKGYPYLNSITYKPIINANSRADALETGEIDIMHTNDPDGILLFRGNKKYAYYDNSGQVLGQPTVQCVMLNTNAAPLTTRRPYRHGQVHQPDPIRQGDRQGREHPHERAVHPGQRVLHQDLVSLL